MLYNFHKLRACRIKHLDPPWTSLLMVRCVSNITICCLYYNLLSHCLHNSVYNRAIHLRVGLNDPARSLSTWWFCDFTIANKKRKQWLMMKTLYSTVYKISTKQYCEMEHCPAKLLEPLVSPQIHSNAVMG